jgi:hypothetical protein
MAAAPTWRRVIARDARENEPARSIASSPAVEQWADAHLCALCCLLTCLLPPLADAAIGKHGSECSMEVQH